MALLTLVASVIGTLAGFGSSTIMLPIVVLFYPLPQALLLVGIIHIFNDLWQMLLFKHAVDKKLLLEIAIPGVILSFIGAVLVVELNQDVLLKTLGMILIGYVLLLVFKPTFELPKTTLSKIFGGSLSGFMAGITGIGGPVRSMFLSAYNLPKEVYLFTSGAIAILIDAARLLVYLGGGTQFDATLKEGLVLLIPISFIGAEIAKKFVDKIPQHVFRYVIALLLLVVGTKLAFF